MRQDVIVDFLTELMNKGIESTERRIELEIRFGGFFGSFSSIFVDARAAMSSAPGTGRYHTIAFDFSDSTCLTSVVSIGQFLSLLPE